MQPLEIPSTAPKITATELAQLLTPGYGLNRRQVYERIRNPELRSSGPASPSLARCGHLFEGAIVEEVLERKALKLVDRQVARYAHPVSGIADALAFDSKSGDVIAIEAKVVTYLTELKAAYFNWQAEIYTYLLGVPRVVVGVFVLRSWNPFFDYWIYTTTPERRAHMLKELQRFYVNYVVPEVPPEEEQSNALAVEANKELLALVRSYAEAMSKAKEWEKRAEAYRTQIKQAMGTAKRLTHQGHVVAQRIGFLKELVDTKALKEAGLYDTFTKSIEVEQLRLDLLNE